MGRKEVWALAGIKVIDRHEAENHFYVLGTRDDDIAICRFAYSGPGRKLTVLEEVILARPYHAWSADDAVDYYMESVLRLLTADERRLRLIRAIDERFRDVA